MAKIWREFEPGYSPATYTRTGIKALSDEELTREYARVRREATERLRSFRRSKDPEIRDSPLAAEKTGIYLTIKDIGDLKTNRGLMEDLLLDAMKFVKSKRSSVSGTRDIRMQTARSLQASGYDIKDKDLKAFGDFMDYARDRRDSRRWGSGSVVSLFSKAKTQKISQAELKKHFTYYMNQIQGGSERLTRWKK